MDTRWKRIDDLLNRALDLPPDRWREFVDSCTDDASDRDELWALLRHAREKSDLPGGDDLFAEIVHDELDVRSPSDPLLGSRLGAFQIEQSIGQGGMADVYRASRTQDFDQSVALKVIKRGMVNEDLLARFDRERRLLATVDHPNVARLIDGGLTPDERPYLVMELVEGAPITDFARDRKLSARDTLRLFLQVLDAVSHAHRNLVLHRDIKPSNVLVDSSGRVKLLDFGIASTLDSSGSGQQSVEQRRFLTPGWASPEQLRDDPLTTTSDVYQLGLMLFRLLTGQTPPTHEPSRGAEVLRAIETSPAVAPSSLLEGAERRCVRGDLDVIVGKALHVEPERRYGSVDEFRADLIRHLDGEPISARPDTLSYRVTKLVKRYPFAAAFAAVAVGAIAALALVSTIQARSIAIERDRANSEAAAAQSVSDFLTRLFEISDPSQSRGETVTARELLDTGAKRISELDDQPAVQLRMLRTVSDVYASLGLHESAYDLAEQAVEAATSLHGEQSSETLDARSRASAELLQLSRLDEAEATARAVLEEGRPPREEDALAMLRARSTLAGVEQLSGQFSEALERYREVEHGFSELLGPNHIDTIKSRSNMAASLFRLGRYDECIPLYEELIETTREEFGSTSPLHLLAKNRLANVYNMQERYELAEPLYMSVLASRERVLGPTHASTTTTRYNLAALYKSTGRLDRALEAYEAIYEAQLQTLGANHLKTMRTHNAIGDVYSNQGHYARAESLFRDNYERQARVLGADSLDALLTRFNIGSVLADQGKVASAKREMVQARDSLIAKLGDEHPYVEAIAARLAEVESQGR